MNGLEILEYTGEGYQPVMAFEQWRVALHNYAECADKDKMKKLERHMCTDEVFVLLEGKATLVIGKEKAACKMEKGKIYNVKKGIWHSIAMSRDAKVLIVENDDTTENNSEYIYEDYTTEL